MTVIITSSEDATIRLGSRRADGSTFAPLNVDVKAGEAKTIEYIGYLNEYEPFSVRINSELEAESVTLSVQLVSVVAHNGENLPEYHTKVEEKPKVNYEELPKDESAYDLQLKTNGETMSSPDKWHYNQGESSVVSSVKYNNGTITFDFETLQTTGNSQLRYRPTLEGTTKIKVEFTVTSNVAAKVVLALCDSQTFSSAEWNEKRLDGTNSQTFTAEMTLKEVQLIYIQVQALGETASNASFTFSNIKIYKEAADQAGGNEGGGNDPVNPPVSDNELTSSNNSGVVANPGKWFYSADGKNGNEYEFASMPTFANGVLTFAFNRMAELNADGNQPTYQLRYQPDFAVDTEYTVTFTVTVTAAGKVVYGNDYKAHEFSEAGSKTLTWTGKVSASAPFMIQIRSTDRSAPITMTVSDIKFEKKQAENNDQTGGEQTKVVYDITPSNNSGVVANPGRWFYMCDGADGTDYAFASAPKYDDGTITFAFNKMAELNIEGKQPTYQLRYQPELDADTEYTITFKVNVSAAGKIVYGTDYKSYEFTEAGTQTITWSGKVSSSSPFSINIRSTDRTAPITLTVSEIVITEA